MIKKLEEEIQHNTEAVKALVERTTQLRHLKEFQESISSGDLSGFILDTTQVRYREVGLPVTTKSWAHTLLAMVAREIAATMAEDLGIKDRVEDIPDPQEEELRAYVWDAVRKARGLAKP